MIETFTVTVDGSTSSVPVGGIVDEERMES